MYNNTRKLYTRQRVNLRRQRQMLEAVERHDNVQVEAFGPVFRRRFQFTVNVRLRHGGNVAALKTGLYIEWDAQFAKAVKNIRTKIISIQHCGFKMKRNKPSAKEELRVIRSNANSVGAGAKCEIVIEGYGISSGMHLANGRVLEPEEAEAKERERIKALQEEPEEPKAEWRKYNKVDLRRGNWRKFDLNELKDLQDLELVE